MTDINTSQIVVVWSAFGHRFIGEDGNHEQCLTCGAVFQLLPEPSDPARGSYCAVDGSDPVWCSGDTGTVHGYPSEREDGPNHGCNCLLCDS